MIISVVCVFAVFTGGIAVYYTYSQINRYNFNDCAVGIYDYGGEKIIAYLNDAQQKEFIEILDSADTTGFGSDAYTQTAGSRY